VASHQEDASVIVLLARAALLGLLCTAGQAVQASEPGRLPLAPASSNQAVADAVAGRLRQSDLLRGYRIDVTVLDGRVELTGRVANQEQREEAVRIVRAVSGVGSVSDRLTAVEGGIAPVQATAPTIEGGSPPTIEGPGGVTPPVGPPPIIEGPTTPPGVVTPPVNGGNGGGIIPEPAPIYRAQVPAYYGLTPPQLPPHAWPTYAPYNNYSRCAYPTAYPYNAWPFIGPLYPFPKVPLGWRSVRLQWDDGYWWFGRVGHPYDWWRLRFW